MDESILKQFAETIRQPDQGDKTGAGLYKGLIAGSDVETALHDLHDYPDLIRLAI